MAENRADVTAERNSLAPARPDRPMCALERDYWNGFDKVRAAKEEANVSSVIRASVRKSRTPLQMGRERFAELFEAMDAYEAERRLELEQAKVERDEPKILARQLSVALSVAAGYMVAYADQSALRTRADGRARRAIARNGG